MTVENDLYDEVSTYLGLVDQDLEVFLKTDQAMEGRITGPGVLLGDNYQPIAIHFRTRGGGQVLIPWHSISFVKYINKEGKK